MLHRELTSVKICFFFDTLFQSFVMEWRRCKKIFLRLWATDSRNWAPWNTLKFWKNDCFAKPSRLSSKLFIVCENIMICKCMEKWSLEKCNYSKRFLWFWCKMKCIFEWCAKDAFQNEVFYLLCLTGRTRSYVSSLWWGIKAYVVLLCPFFEIMLMHECLVLDELDEDFFCMIINEMLMLCK